jgi:hypothetical protein
MRDGFSYFIGASVSRKRTTSAYVAWRPGAPMKVFMSRTAATLKQADIARSIRAAKQAGASSVEVVLPGGTIIRIPLNGKPDVRTEDVVL